MQATKWERRDAKAQSKRNLVSDNRNSVRLLNSLAHNGEVKKLKRVKRKFR